MHSIIPIIAAVALGTAMPASAAQADQPVARADNGIWIVSDKTGSLHSPRAQAIFDAMSEEYDG